MLETLAISWLISAALIYAWFYFVEIILDLPVTGQTPCSAHATLKAIIRRVLRDASNMAILQEPTQEEEQQENQSNDTQTYEDLLATAILNKVIDNYQHELRRSSSSSSSSRKEKPHKSKKSKHAITSTPAPPVNKEEVRPEEKEDIWKPQEIDSTSVSSVEDWCRSESSFCSKRIDPISLTIQHSIEELSTSEDDFIQQNTASLRTSGPSSLEHDQWQDNWLFSRKGKTSPKPVPVPMLVPSPNTELRAMIGDRDADDTTDLSETGSDIDDSETVTSLKNILVDSRTIIGGKNLLDGVNPELLEPHEDFKDSEDSKTEVHIHAEVIVNGYHGLDNESLDGDLVLENGISLDECDRKVDSQGEYVVEHSKINGVNCNGFQNGFSEAKNDVIIKETPYEESDSLGSNTEQDAEYTEKYASFPRPIKKKSPMPSPRVSVTANGEEHNKIKNEVQTNGVLENGHDDKNSSEEEGPPVSFEGTYSAREKEKWNHPIKLENNPYSKENLDKRLKNKIFGDMFGRDYYIRDSKRAAGGKIDENEAIEVSESDFQSPKLSPLTKSSGFVEEEYYSEKDSSLESEKLSRPISLALSSDSDDIDVKRIYNVETGKIQKVKPADITKEIRENAKSPIGLKNFIVQEMYSPTELSTLEEKFDENHNHSYENENIPINEPVMKISSIENLKNIGIKDVPYEEKIASIDLSDEYSLDESVKESIQSPVDSSLENVEIRDISKKYLNSLVKSKQPYVVNNFSTPPVSIRESSPLFYEEKLSSPVLLSPISPTLEKNDLKSQSCTDLSNGDIRNSFIDEEYPSLKERKIVSQFMKSVPNIQELSDSVDGNERVKKNKSVDILEAEGINEKPSVKNLRKLFDNNNEKKESSLPQKKTSHLELPTSSPKHVHSLTARSLPTLVRKELKIEANEIDISARNGHNTELTEEELKQIKGCRSKIEFFEKLKKY